MSESPEISLESIKYEPVKELASTNEVMMDEAELEARLRSMALDVSEDDLAALWSSLISLCRQVLPRLPSTAKLPFVVLEDLVDTLPSKELWEFWTETIRPTTHLCTGDLWKKSSASVKLQFLKVCNKLMSRLPDKRQHVLLHLASALSLSDRSSFKVYGTARATTNLPATTESSDAAAEDEEELSTDLDEELLGLTHDSSFPNVLSFYETFVALQTDFGNPFKINDFGAFIKKMNALLSSLEGDLPTTTGTSACATTTAETGLAFASQSKRTLRMKVASSTSNIGQHVMTQFLIAEALLSGQSASLRTTLQPLRARCMELLNKEFSRQLEWLLSKRETNWRDWKKAKCKPEMDLVPPPPPPNKSAAEGTPITNGTADRCNAPHQQRSYGSSLSMPRLEDVATISKRMMEDHKPTMIDHLEFYVDALDPDSGIEAEYHPKKDPVYSWRALRLLSSEHLSSFDKLQRSSGDYENLVRHVYQETYDTKIPGVGLPEEKLEVEVAKAPKLAKEEHREGDVVTDEKATSTTKAEMKAATESRRTPNGHPKEDATATKPSVPNREGEKLEKINARQQADGEDTGQQKEDHSMEDEEASVETQSSQEETEEQREKRYAGMSEFDRATAEEEDELARQERQERRNRKREVKKRKEAARKKRKADEEAAAKKKAEEEAAEEARKKKEEDEAGKKVDAGRKRRRSRSPSPRPNNRRRRSGRDDGAPPRRNERGPDPIRNDQGGGRRNDGRREGRDGRGGRDEGPPRSGTRDDAPPPRRGREAEVAPLRGRDDGGGPGRSSRGNRGGDGRGPPPMDRRHDRGQQGPPHGRSGGPPPRNRDDGRRGGPPLRDDRRGGRRDDGGGYRRR